MLQPATCCNVLPVFANEKQMRLLKRSRGNKSRDVAVLSEGYLYY